MKLSDIAEEIRTQDNLATADPIVILFDWKKIPTTNDYSDNYYYIDDYESEEIGETKEDILNYVEGDDFLTDEIRKLSEKEIVEKAHEHGWSWSKIWYIKVKEYKQCFFTMKSAKAYLESNKHHHPDPFLYITSLWRNKEMKAVRQALMENRFIDVDGDILKLLKEKQDVQISEGKLLHCPKCDSYRSIVGPKDEFGCNHMKCYDRKTHKRTKMVPVEFYNVLIPKEE